MRSLRRATLLYAVLFLAALAGSVYISNFFPDRLAAGAPKLGDYIYDLLPVLSADHLFAGTKTEGSLAYWYFNLPKYLKLLLETVNMALFATILGTVGGLVMCFAASRNLAPNNWVYQGRSEEHTSELQSLMRISYAVFCLKKKIHNNTLDQKSIPTRET